jgi:hypothetical protein
VIKLHRTLLSGLEDRHPQPSAIIAALQRAIELEHSTIPLYLYALYSLDQERNRAIAKLIKSVVVEEMLHMVLAANVVNALGGRPEIAKVNFIPHFPGHLPGGVEGQLALHLRPFSLDQLEAFIEIEEPRQPLALAPDIVPEEGEPTTIGEFYTAIGTAISRLGADAFADAPRHQVGPDLMFGSVAVTDVASALEAIEIIIEQGEGTGTSPKEIDGPGGHDDYAHFYRLAQVREGRRLEVNQSSDPDAPAYEFSGEEIVFDPAGVFPVPDDPSSALYADDPDAHNANEDFNHAYTELLHTLHHLVNGKADDDTFTAALEQMRDLEHRAKAMASGVAVPGRHLGPSFEYHPAHPGSAHSH